MDPGERSVTALELSQLLSDVTIFESQLATIKRELAPETEWYPYDSLSNLWHFDRLLTGPDRDLAALADGCPILDIGAADGDVAFFLAKHGARVEILDWGPTNWNGLRGARRLAAYFDLDVTLHEIDLDSQFGLPHDRYGLVLLLGTLYHLQNPFYVLKHLASAARHVIVSTRIARVTSDGAIAIDRAPVAYLVDARETNNDPTNYWIFSMPGLRRLFDRTGWDLVAETTVGRTQGDSDPSSNERDERAFCLLRSRMS